MNDLQVTKAIKDATKKVKSPHSPAVQKQVNIQKTRSRTMDDLVEQAYDEIKGGSGFSGDYKYDADILANEIATVGGKIYDDLPDIEKSGIYDLALKRVSQDLLKRREARKALKDVEQKIELQMFDTKGKTPHASGGIAGQLHLNRPGYSGGTLVKLLNLLKGKKKNVWRGFETDYKNILRGDWYPEEFSGRFFTPDKDLAKWYAMRQGTLTGKVKKLKLTEKEIKEAQEFAEKNLKMKYGDDLLVSEELAKKATVDLPATALAKIEAVIRKAKRTKKPKKHGQTDWAKGGLAKILGV
tara:strand:- start:10 stop:903 length:894 start_codon:yes stop_codon:yes gene_type:complete